jgi:hypothetical protein
LLIFNTDTRCLEYWNTEKWVSFCEGDTPPVLDPCAGFETMNRIFCNGATIAHLTQRAIDAGGRGNVQWWDAETGGNLLDPGASLTTRTYWADNCAGETSRIPVAVSVGNCTRLITAWTTAMYDFQEQTLSHYSTINLNGAPFPEIATSWQWEVRDGLTGTNWQPIAGANEQTFTIPDNFMYSSYTGVSYSGTEPTRELSFRVIRTIDDVAVITGNFNMLFIRTNTSGYCPVTVPANERGLAMDRAGSTPSIHFALLNLGATNDNSLGDFYQWGRMRNGHERIVWDKNMNTLPNTGANIIEPQDGIGTSAVAARGTMAAMGVDDALGGQVTLGAGVDRFIVNIGGDWGSAANPESDGRWGRANATNRVTAPTLSTEWDFPANNPCTAVLGPGWRVPNRWELFDIHDGDSDGNTHLVRSDLAFFAFFPNRTNTTSGNGWAWRNGQNGAAGGAVVFNLSGEALFLPAAGVRQANATFFVGAGGNYWSSTTDYTTSRNNAYVLWFGDGMVMAGNDVFGRASGNSVRCVRD